MLNIPNIVCNWCPSNNRREYLNPHYGDRPGMKKHTCSILHAHTHSHYLTLEDKDTSCGNLVTKSTLLIFRIPMSCLKEWHPTIITGFISKSTMSWYKVWNTSWTQGQTHGRIKTSTHIPVQATMHSLAHKWTQTDRQTQRLTHPNLWFPLVIYLFKLRQLCIMTYKKNDVSLLVTMVEGSHTCTW